MINLNDKKGGIYAQDGEEGILVYLMNHIDRSNFFIEFGAADGFSFSNTAMFWQQYDRRALLIEADNERFEELVKIQSDTIETIHGLVENLDDFTTEVADVCSIDVDGNEYYILERLETPHSILVVEHNPTVPPHIEMVGEENTPTGSSALSLVNLAREKNYTLVAATECNLIFLKDTYDHSDYVTNLETLFDSRWLSYVVSDYRGRHRLLTKWPWGKAEEGRLNVRRSGTDPLFWI